VAAGEWYRIEGQWFCCGVKVEGGEVVATPPVLDWVLVRKDHSLAWLLAYAKKRKWKVEQLLPVSQGRLL
jgi:hypothetical protein